MVPFMKILCIHSDFMEYKVTEPVKKIAEEIDEHLKSARMEECLTVFFSVERGDEGDTGESCIGAAKEIRQIAKQLGVSRLMLYPYAHLSSDLAKPAAARKAAMELEELLSPDYEVKRSPFGWYKSFTISCKGHPLSELSKHIGTGTAVTGTGPRKNEGAAPAGMMGGYGKGRDGAGDAGGKNHIRGETGIAMETGIDRTRTRDEIAAAISSEYHVLTPDGRDELIDLERIKKHRKFLNEFPTLKTFIMSEEVKGQPSAEPPSIKLMQRMELVDYEDASDSGHFRYFPRGALVFNLLREWSDTIARELGCLEIDTPVIYDWQQEDIRSQVRSFHERHYMVHTPENREFVLRFAGDFGLFRMMKNAALSYRTLPVRVYEFSKSFRFEKRGELSGLRRLRAFHMPDIHSFAADIEQAWDEFAAIYKMYAKFSDATGVEYAIAFRIVKDFFEEHGDKLLALSEWSGKPVFVEVLSEMKHYWVVKTEFQGIDSIGGNCQLSTVQIDIEDSERYGIGYTDRDGERRPCIIQHCSIGSIERWIYEILENAMKMEKPMLPYWLSPTQLRLLPVSAEFMDDCRETMKEIHDIHPDIRIDIDDRDEKIGRKIRDAEREWVPLIGVFGERERESGKIALRMRDGTRGGRNMDATAGEIAEMAREKMADYPFRPLPLPVMVSKRISFR